MGKDVRGKTSDALLTSHPDQPRASSPINDNYCVKVLQAGLLAGSKQPTPEKTVNSLLPKTLVNSVVVNPVLTAPGLSQRKICPGMSGCYQKCKLKYLEDVFCVDQLSFVKPETNVQLAVCKSACRGQTSKLLANLTGSGCRSKSQRGLHPPLSDLAKLDKVTNYHKLLCQSSQKPLPVRSIASAYGQKCSRASSK